MVVSVCVSVSAVDLVQQLLAVSSSSTYWLAKVELLRTLACLPLTALALSLPSLPHSLLSLCVFPLLGDSDHRSAPPSPWAHNLLLHSFPQSQNSCFRSHSAACTLPSDEL